jgi:AcrR family transcriptional regulator
MATRGDATRAKLTEATRRVVGEVGYGHATTKAIAQAAGVAEGTIYRHFPDKNALFLAAILESHEHIAKDLDDLPARAGSATLEANLGAALRQMARMRDAVLPLEIAMIAEPDTVRMAAVQAHLTDGTELPGPPGALAAYLKAEQRLGRVRPDLNCEVAAMTLMSSLLGLALMPLPSEQPELHDALVDGAVDVVVRGIRSGPGPDCSGGR